MNVMKTRLITNFDTEIDEKIGPILINREKKGITLLY
jgi:hypothetical protein